MEITLIIKVMSQSLSDIPGWEVFFREIMVFLEDINRHAGSSNENYCEYVVQRLAFSISNVSMLADHLSSRPPLATSTEIHIANRFAARLIELVECLRRFYTVWLGHRDEDRNRHFISYSAPSMHSTTAGRPKFSITQHQLLYLRSMSFSWVQISKLLGVSYMTVYRRCQEYGISEVDNRRDISDEDLQEFVSQQLPTMGQTMIWGKLRSMGIKVTRKRVRQTMRECDPINNALRWQGQLVQRRPYSVPGPNSLWHLGIIQCNHNANIDHKILRGPQL